MRVGVKIKFQQTPNKCRKPIKESMKCISRRFVDYLPCNNAINENNAVATSCYAIKSDFGFFALAKYLNIEVIYGNILQLN